MSRSRHPSSNDPERPNPDLGRPHVPIIGVGLVLFFALLWFGVEVLGDRPDRSLLMSGLVTAMAATGYTLSRRR